MECLSKHASTPSISDNDFVCNCGVEEVDTNMSYRYKDSPSQPSSLPRRYYSLPKNYSGSNTNNGKDSSHSTRYRSTSSSSTNSSTTPSSQSLRYGSLRTYGTSTNSSLTDDLKKPTSRRSGTSSLSSRPIGSSSIPRKSSYGSIKTGSTTLRDSTPSYSTRHVSTISNRNAGSSSLNTESNWIPGGVPIRQRSSITLRETEHAWGPRDPPVRQHSSSSLRDSPFTLPTRRTRSSSAQGFNSDSETRTSSSRKLSLETVSRRPILPSSVNDKDYGKSEENLKASSHRKVSSVETKSATSSPTVRYAGSHEAKPEKPASPTSPTVQYFGSLPRKDSSTASGSQRESGSSGSQGAPSDNGDELESSAARDISLLSREIASVYEGSLSRSDSKKGTTSNLVKKQKSIEGNSSKESAKLEKQLSNEKKLNSNGRSSQGQSSGRDERVKIKKSHKRSVSAGSATVVKDENKVRPARKITGLFSRKKSRESTDSEDDEDRLQKRSSGLFSRKDSKDSVKDSVKGSPTRRGSKDSVKDSVKGSPTRRGSSSSSHSPPVTPPKRKISGPGRLFSFSSDSKTTPELPKKFSVPGKYFTSKEAKSGEESSDLESESSRPRLKRRVSLPGMLGLPRSASAERTSGGRRLSPEPSVDPALLQRRRSNFKKAQSFDVQNEKSKNSMLSKLKFWDQTKKDKSPDSRHSASPEEGRSRSTSPTVEPSADKNTTEEKSESKTSQSRKSRERVTRRKSSQEKEVPELKVTSESIKPDTTSTISGDEKLQVSPKVTHSSKEDDSVNKTVKEPKVRYVGPVETPSLELHTRKRAEYNVNSVDKDNGSTVNAAEKSTQSKEPAASNADKVQVKPLDASDGSTRDTVLKLRERRRRRREERERFFAGLQPAANTTKEATSKDQTLQSENVKNLESNATTEVTQDEVDGRTTTADNKLEEKTREVSTERNNHRDTERVPKISVIGKRSSVDDVEKGKMKNGTYKPRYKTIASSVHADIINDLIREKGLKTTTNTEVKIPSVAELRAKFLISKDDAKVTPPRPILKLEDRPHSICGGVLSPTEMKKFEDITFSLAKKVSSDDVKMKKFSDSSSDSLPKLDTQWKPLSVANNEKSPPSSPNAKSSSKKEKKVDKVTNEENQLNEEQDLCPENDSLRRRRGSKKKRKKSLFGSDKDKEPKSPEEDVDMSQHGAVSSAIKAMFSRRPSTTDKVKVSRKQRSKTMPGSPERDTISSETESRERKKSAPEYTAEPKTPDAQPVKVKKKDAKDEKIVKIEEVKDLEKEKDIELQSIADLEQKPVKERKSLKKRKYIYLLDIQEEISPF